MNDAIPRFSSYGFFDTKVIGVQHYRIVVVFLTAFVRDNVSCSKRNSVTDTLIIIVQSFYAKRKGIIKHLAI